jgi:hypothetical protein
LLITIFLFLLLAILTLSLLPNPSPLQSLLIGTEVVSGQIAISQVSTRNHFDLENGELKEGHSLQDYASLSVPGFPAGVCPPEIAVYVHGVWVGAGSLFEGSLEEPSEIFNRVAMSIAKNHYTIPVVGYSWDSNTAITGEGWTTSKEIAQENGPKLAQFISDYKDRCNQQQNSDVKIRLIGHSLGSRVILSSLANLDVNAKWNELNYNITSVHLLGPAVDNEEISKNVADIDGDSGIKSAYGNAIENQVVEFQNLYNPEDDVLEWDTNECSFIGFRVCQPVYYPIYEDDFALGQRGAQSGIDMPENYSQKNVRSGIDFNVDADGDGFCDLIIPFTMFCSIFRTGDNHFGYIGFRSPFDHNVLISDGALNIVVSDWRAP